jgi:hypothetical protein
MQRLTPILGLLALVVGPGGRLARADSGFRCPSGRLVTTGDQMAEVQNKCGEPDAVTQRTEKRKIKVKVRHWISPTVSEEISEEREIDVLVDEWTYDFGSNRFLRFVDFEDARVVGVSTGGYGRR